MLAQVLIAEADAFVAMCAAAEPQGSKKPSADRRSTRGQPFPSARFDR